MASALDGMVLLQKLWKTRGFGYGWYGLASKTKKTNGFGYGWYGLASTTMKNKWLRPWMVWSRFKRIFDINEKLLKIIEHQYKIIDKWLKINTKSPNINTKSNEHQLKFKSIKYNQRKSKPHAWFSGPCGTPLGPPKKVPEASETKKAELWDFDVVKKNIPKNEPNCLRFQSPPPRDIRSIKK